MLDLTGILFSTILMILVILNAVRLDRSQPWFQRAAHKSGQVHDTSNLRKPWQSDSRR